MRTTLRLLRWMLLVLAALSCAAPAWGQAPKPLREELPETLRDDWDAAGDMFDDGNHRGALVQYERIYAETKNPRILYNIGITWKELRRYAKAIAAWEKQLTFRDQLDEREITRAEKAIEVVRPFVSTMEVTSNEPGATLEVNGEDVGATPFLAPITVDVGENEVVLRKDGFVTLTRKVAVVRGEPTKVSLELVKAQKTAKVSISIAGVESATIFVDGTEMGPAPFSGEVSVGRHTFEARAKGYVTARQTSEIVEGETVRITLTMAEARAEGKVRIEVAGHPDAQIRVDGEDVGRGAWEGVLPAGGHDLEVEKDGYELYESELALVADQERTLRIELMEDNTASWIYWAVTGVVVAAGSAVATYFVLRPADSPAVNGTLDPSYPTLPTVFRF